MAALGEPQLFTLKVDESDMEKIISGLMNFPAGNVYNLLKNLEKQTTEQRNLPDDKKEFATVKSIKKED